MCSGFISQWEQMLIHMYSYLLFLFHRLQRNHAALINWSVPYFRADSDISSSWLFAFCEDLHTALADPAFRSSCAPSQPQCPLRIKVDNPPHPLGRAMCRYSYGNITYQSPMGRCGLQSIILFYNKCSKVSCVWIEGIQLIGVKLHLKPLPSRPSGHCWPCQIWFLLSVGLLPETCKAIFLICLSGGIPFSLSYLSKHICLCKYICICTDIVIKC